MSDRLRAQRPPAKAGPPRHVTLTRGGLLRGMRRLLPVGLFIVPFGVAFGVAATEEGLNPVQATLMSVFIFTAIAQFAALDFLREPVAYVSLGLVVLALSGRHVIMGAALSRWVNRLPLPHRLAALGTLTDANFADALPGMQRGDNDVGVLLGGGVLLWIVWVASTAVGAFGGDLLGDTDAYGFGAVMLCFFAATVVGMVRGGSRLVVPVAVAMGVSAATQPFLPTGWNIILAALVGGGAAVWRDAE
ncbi:MAG: AzlC family ABC transporter permease [Acuticoccus sp.]